MAGGKDIYLKHEDIHVDLLVDMFLQVLGRVAQGGDASAQSALLWAEWRVKNEDKRGG